MKRKKSTGHTGKHSRANTDNKGSNANQLTDFSRRNALKIGLGLGTVVLGAGALHAYDTKNKGVYDLSTLGQGTPTIVQIHDPGCPTCRRLKSIVTNALSGHEQIDFKLANIKTKEGKALQNKYDVPHVTLLFFDARGEHVHTTRGLQTKTELKAVIERVYKSEIS